MTTPVIISAFLNNRDFTERVLGDIVWTKGRPNPGSIERELQAGRAEITLDNTDGFFTKAIGRFHILPGSELSVNVLGFFGSYWPVSRYTIAGYDLQKINNEYSVIAATFGGTLYKITASDISIGVVAGRADRVLRTLVDRIDPNIVIENPNNLLQQGIIIYENKVLPGILTLLQNTDTTLIETGGNGVTPDHLEIVDKGSGTPYHLYDGGLNSEIPILVR